MVSMYIRNETQNWTKVDFSLVFDANDRNGNSALI